VGDSPGQRFPINAGQRRGQKISQQKKKNGGKGGWEEKKERKELTKRYKLPQRGRSTGAEEC